MDNILSRAHLLERGCNHQQIDNYLIKNSGNICEYEPVIESRIKKLGIMINDGREYYTVGANSLSAIPPNRSVVLGKNDAIKTTSFKVSKGYRAEEKTEKWNEKWPEFPKGWLMSEKKDGNRVIYDGCLFMTSGGSVPQFIPDWIKILMPPSIPLDGEMWMGRNTFASNHKGVNGGVNGMMGIKIGQRKTYTKQMAELKWTRIKLCIFDVIDHPGQLEERLNFLKKIIEARQRLWPNIREYYYKKILPLRPDVASILKNLECPLQFETQYKIENVIHMTTFLKNITNNNGEGIIIRKPDSYYQTKRTDEILKYKQCMDAEAKVIGINPTKTAGSKYDDFIELGTDGTKRKVPVMGSMKCILTDSAGNPKTLNGHFIEFDLNAKSDEFRWNWWNPEKPDYYVFDPDINVGAIVSFTFMKYQPTGKPREPIFWRIRVPIGNEPTEGHKKLDPIIENKSNDDNNNNDNKVIDAIIPRTPEELLNRLIKDFSVILIVAKIKRKNLKTKNEKIGNSFRIKTYENAIQILEDILDDVDDEDDNGRLRNCKLTDMQKIITNRFMNNKPKRLVKACDKMNNIIQNGILFLDKEPYNGVIVINGTVENEELQREIEGLTLLKPIMDAKIGIGQVRIMEIIEAGYSNIDELEKTYREDPNLSDYIIKKLDDFFSGSDRTQRMTRDEATHWKNSIVNCLKSLKSLEEFKELKGSMAGSYIRGNPTVGDIDYVITHPDCSTVYKVMDILFNKFQKGQFIVNNEKVKIIRVEDYPKIKNQYRNHNQIKIWTQLGNKPQHIKIEIYAYAQPNHNFIFATLARSAEVNYQRKIRWWSEHYHQLRLCEHGFKSPPIKEGKVLEPGDKKIVNKIGKPYFETIDDIEKFLDFNW